VNEIPTKRPPHPHPQHTRARATLRIDDIDPGSPLYHAWVDSVSAIFNSRLSELTGIPGLIGLRERPRYKNEH